MARPAGRRNADFDDKRDALARRLRVAWMGYGAGVTVNELATAAGVSVPTLKHYFGDRDGVFQAIAEEMHREGQRFMDDAATPRGHDARSSLLHFLKSVVIAWRHFGIGRLHAVGIAEGLGGAARGHAYVSHVLEPTLDTCERLLAKLVDERQLRPLELRSAALSLAGPVLLALLHQDGLDGVACRPLDVDAFVTAHVDGWLPGHARRRRPR